ncbi:MAG: tandem-95 repeat protein, partial [Candidatus Latescibacteria bacterium]|nr:tandem-95 repeat protein [Candidatus Latescibacterota bacterium]
PVNDAPVAANDGYAVDEDATLTIAALGVLANDSDPEGNNLTAVLVNDVSNGTLTLDADGSFTYTPDADFNGTDIFTYKANDGELNSDEATVTITVKAVNDAPVVDGQSVTTPEDKPVDIALTGSDSDVEDVLTYSVLEGPSHGTLSGSAPNLTYTPNLDYNGADSFTFKANDGADDSNVATVTIAVNVVNDAPSFVKGADQGVLEDAGVQTVSGWTTGISAGPSDESGQVLTFNVTANTNPGLFAVQPSIHAGTGSLTYTPADDVNGCAIVTMTLSDNGGTDNGGVDTSPEQTFAITVTPVNDAPVVVINRGITVNEGMDAIIPNTSLQVTDVDNAPVEITYTVGTVPANGNLKRDGTPLAVDGTFTQADMDARLLRYEHDGSETDRDRFIFTVNDGAGGSIEAIPFEITVNPVNDAPVLAVVDTVADEGEDLHFTVCATDVDGDDLTFSAGNLPEGASFDPTTQLFSWTPDFTQAGTYPDVHFEVTDGNTTDSADITIIVNNVTPTPLTEQLIAYVISLDLLKGIEKSLTSKLNNVIKSLEKGNDRAAINQLGAFINEVEAQRGKKLTEADADALMAAAHQIIEVIDVEAEEATKLAMTSPDYFRLFQNHPNPFNPVTTIRYQLSEASHVELAIYDVLGRKVRMLVDGFEQAGYRSVVWEAEEAASGIYFVRMEAGGFVVVRKMAVVR